MLASLELGDNVKNDCYVYTSIVYSWSTSMLESSIEI